MILNVVELASALTWAVVLGYKLTHLRRDPRNPRLWAICAAMFFPAVTTAASSPVAMRWVDQVTGVPNIAQPIVAVLGVLTAASWLALAFLWRYPTKQGMARIRWVLLAGALDIVVLVLLFALSDVPEERLHQDFGVYYVPRQFTVFIYHLCYLTPLAVAMSLLAVWCLTWAREDGYADLPWLRRGLRLYGAFCILCVMFFVTQLLAVIAARFHTHALDTAATVVLVAMSIVAIPLLPAALIVPTLGPRLPAIRDRMGRWRAYLALRPLHRALRHVDPAVVMVSRERRLDPHHRVRRMVIELSDWRWQLALLFDPALGESVTRKGQEAGLGDEELKAAVEAAQLKAAVQAMARDGAHVVRRDGSGHGREEDLRDGSGVAAEIAWWTRVARAYHRPPFTIDPAVGPSGVTVRSPQ